MSNIENYNIKSELLKEHWQLISESYVKIYNESLLYKNKTKLPDETYGSMYKYVSLVDIFIKEWQRLYPKFILEAIKEDILDFFVKIQRGEFEKQKGIKKKIKVFIIWYYFIQGRNYNLFVMPDSEIYKDLEFEKMPRMKIEPKSNRYLYEKIFKEIWDEIDMPDYDDSFETESDIQELDLFRKFMSDCWNDVALKTNSKVIGIINESTGADSCFFLNENRVITNFTQFYNNYS